MAELFKWPPQFHEDWNNTDEWKTVVSRFENHATQRRSKWSRRYGKWKFIFSKEVATNSADDMMDFFNARKGMAEYFYLPSWKKEFRLQTGYNYSIIPNSDVEQGLTGWTGDVQFTVDFNGTQCFRIHPEATTSTYELKSGMIEVNPNASWNASGKIVTINVTNGLSQLQILQYDTNQNFLTSSSIAYVNSSYPTSWTNYSVNIGTLNPSCKYIVYRIRVDLGDTGFWYFDDFSMKTTSIILENTSSISTRLTNVAGQRGNLIHISNDEFEGSTGDVFQITAINSNVLTATRLAGSNSSYMAGTFVNIAYEAYFSNDVLMQENILPVLYRVGLEFEEK